VNWSSPVYCLPKWDSKIIEFSPDNVEDASSEWKYWSQKKHANVSLMIGVVDTSNPVTYSDVEEGFEWVHAM